MKKRLRHQFVYKLVGPIMYKVLKKKFNFTYEKCDLKPPFLVFANHTTDYDAFFVTASFNAPVYFVMSDHVSSLKTGKLIKHLVSPIPITKSSVDAETVKNILSVLKQNGAVGIFPEGNKSFAGTQSYIKPSTAKLARIAKVPIVIYNIIGGYLSSPRWSKVKRKGHIHSFVKEIIMPEDLADMTNEELYSRICSGLDISAYEEQEKHKVQFIADNKAENIESLLYYCPLCGGFGTIYGKGDDVLCRTCNLKATFNNYGFLENSPFSRLDEWDLWQKKTLREKEFPLGEVITSDDGWEIQVKKTKFKSIPLGTYSTLISPTHLTLKNSKDEIKIDINDIVGTAIEGVCSIQLSLKDGTVYRLKKDLNTNGLKYVNLISKLKNEPYKF